LKREAIQLSDEIDRQIYGFIYLGSFVEVLICCCLFLADDGGEDFGNVYVLLMNGSCAWWVNEPGLFDHPGLW
jgi:hypothetical protein